MLCYGDISQKLSENVTMARKKQKKNKVDLKFEEVQSALRQERNFDILYFKPFKGNIRSI